MFCLNHCLQLCSKPNPVCIHSMPSVLCASVLICKCWLMHVCPPAPHPPTSLFLMTCFLQRWTHSLPCSKVPQQSCCIHLQEAVFFFFLFKTCYWPQAEFTSDLLWSGKREGKQLCRTRRVFLCHQLIRQTSDIMEKTAKIAEIEGMLPDVCGPALCFSGLRYF